MESILQLNTVFPGMWIHYQKRTSI